MLALTMDDGNDQDMAEMISYEIDSLSRQLAELEDKLKVCFFTSQRRLQFCFILLCQCHCLCDHMLIQKIIFFAIFVFCLFILVPYNVAIIDLEC